MRLREITEGVGRITKQNQTHDVGPDEVTKQAAKFGNKVDKDGRPPTLSKKVKGKSTNVLFNLGLAEGYKLQLERDKELLVLNITDTKTGKRTEVRGKPGYETGGYDPTDSLHILLDKVGKSVDISQLMNGEPVGINPKHPTGADAKTATDKAYSENFVKDSATAIKLIKKYHQTGDDQDAFAAIKHGWNFIKNPKMRSIIVNIVKKVSTANGLPDWDRTVAYIKKNTGIDVSNVNENFADSKKKVQEAFNNPYPITWEYLNPTGASSGIVKLDDGSALDIHFSEEPAGVYEIEFARDGSNKQMGRSGQGDEFRVFATVQAAMLKWWKQLDKTSARKITFYANKQDGNRARLYKRFLKIWGDKSGWEIEVNAKSGLAAYSLTNPNPDKPKNDKKTFMQRVFGKKETVENFATDKSYGESLEEALGEIAPNTEIYVDMDGVLADFFGEWSKSQGVDNWKDIKDPAKAIGDIKNIDDFWLNLPVLPKAKELLALIKQVKGKYKICTSPLADDPRSDPHKREWVKKNLAFFPPEEVIVTHNKPQFAKQKDDTPNILIDDYGVNINAWEEAGGIGFKYKDYKFNRTAKAIKNKIEDPVEENFADGKKKGKSRPGRVKKSGASCNGTVTQLRKRAKNASGEKAKMYHWCANMKGGKK
jgi:5'(3')-deoxyribonucleotidase